MVTAQYLLEESSIEIAARSCVIASMDAVQQLALELKKMPRVAGLIHLAAVLDDATMPKLTRGHLEKSFGAKVTGLQTLRCHSQLPMIPMPKRWQKPMGLCAAVLLNISGECDLRAMGTLEGGWHGSPEGHSGTLAAKWCRCMEQCLCYGGVSLLCRISWKQKLLLKQMKVKANRKAASPFQLP